MVGSTSTTAAASSRNSWRPSSRIDPERLHREPAMPSIDRLGPLTPDDRAAILAPLDEFSRSEGFVWRPEPLALALRGDSGAIVGGLIGELHWGWLRIDILA